MIPKILYCPNCKKIIRVPKMLHTGNIIVQTGFITIECCDKKCGGKVKIKTQVMSKQKMIDEILKFEPEDENGKNGVPAEGDIVFNPIYKKFGQLVFGIYDGWSWFTRINKGFPETLKDSEHKFLEDATEQELSELLSLLKTEVKKQEV